jgi:hypothetical protein
MNTKTHPYTYRNCDATTVTHMLLQGIAQVQEYAHAQGYTQSGDMPTAQALHAGAQAATQTLRKRLLKRAERLHKKTNLRIANQFLHLLCVQLLAYEPDAQAARVSLSEKEAAIRSARKAWLKARTEAETLRLAYLAEKGDFYKRAL